MKILITDLLFGELGGGSTIYDQLIHKNLHIQFYCFIRNHHNQRMLKKYANLQGIPLKSISIQSPRFAHSVIIEAYDQANQIAKSVEGMSFDAVDTPDYYFHGAFLRQAFNRFHVKVNRFVLALHGTISTSRKLGWRRFLCEELDTLTQLETLQYQTYDVRYGISKRYLHEWQKRGSFEGIYVNPFYFLNFPQPIPLTSSGGFPTLSFLGRLEKWKGPDIFLELASYIPKSSHQNIQIAGPNIYYLNGNAVHSLKKYAQERSLSVDFFPSYSDEQKKKLFSSKTLMVLPSRYDTFNLIGLESIFHGCPLALGDGAGLRDFLDELFPQLPYIKISLKNIYSSIPEINHVLQNYDEYRADLFEKLAKLTPLTYNIDFRSIYGATSSSHFEAAEEVDSRYNDWVSQEKKNYFSFVCLDKQSIKKMIRFLFSDKTINQIKSFSWKDLAKQFAKKHYSTKFVWIVYRTIRFYYHSRKLRCLHKPLSLNSEELSHRLNELCCLSKNLKVGRVPIWKEIASIERELKQPLLAATYDLRICRALNGDTFNRLNVVRKELTKCGFSKEAHIAHLMYGLRSSDKCLEYLNEAFQTHRKLDIKNDYEIFDDSRKKSIYRVSIIVSLYNAASKLELFLHAIQHQTLFNKEDAEIIFVETGSPANDYGVFQAMKDSLKMPMLYVRTSQRETIQSAWNRAISLSRAPYLSFLGVDEMNLPSTLEILASELDQHPDIDWVQANSLVTEVDNNGLWNRDVSGYNRMGFVKEHVYLETCYLSWVGALYRKSIHERFGYYDSSFRAAGDTEFKNRVLPYIHTKHLPLNLGVFWNYPDERATSSPVAEIEDLRAWYLHRTPAGIKYAFSQYSLEKLEEIFYRCFSYRKSYCQHLSTDLEYAYHLLVFIQERFPESQITKHEKQIRKALRYMHKIEENPSSYFSYIAFAIIEKIRSIASGEEKKRCSPPIYVFDDNRYEQHNVVWK